MADPGPATHGGEPVTAPSTPTAGKRAPPPSPLKPRNTLVATAAQQIELTRVLAEMTTDADGTIGRYNRKLRSPFRPSHIPSPSGFPSPSTPSRTSPSSTSKSGQSPKPSPQQSPKSSPQQSPSSSAQSTPAKSRLTPKPNRPKLRIKSRSSLTPPQRPSAPTPGSEFSISPRTSTLAGGLLSLSQVPTTPTFTPSNSPTISPFHGYHSVPHPASRTTAATDLRLGEDVFGAVLLSEGWGASPIPAGVSGRSRAYCFSGEWLARGDYSDETFGSPSGEQQADLDHHWAEKEDYIDKTCTSIHSSGSPLDRMYRRIRQDAPSPPSIVLDANTNASLDIDDINDLMYRRTRQGAPSPPSILHPGTIITTVTFDSPLTSEASDESQHFNTFGRAVVGDYGLLADQMNNLGISTEDMLVQDLGEGSSTPFRGLESGTESPPASPGHGHVNDSDWSLDPIAVEDEVDNSLILPDGIFAVALAHDDGLDWVADPSTVEDADQLLVSVNPNVVAGNANDVSVDSAASDPFFTSRFGSVFAQHRTQQLPASHSRWRYDPPSFSEYLSWWRATPTASFYLFETAAPDVVLSSSLIASTVQALSEQVSTTTSDVDESTVHQAPVPLDLNEGRITITVFEGDASTSVVTLSETIPPQIDPSVDSANLASSHSPVIAASVTYLGEQENATPTTTRISDDLLPTPPPFRMGEDPIRVTPPKETLPIGHGRPGSISTAWQNECSSLDWSPSARGSTHQNSTKRLRRVKGDPLVTVHEREKLESFKFGTETHKRTASSPPVIGTEFGQPWTQQGDHMNYRGFIDPLSPAQPLSPVRMRHRKRISTPPQLPDVEETSEDDEAMSHGWRSKYTRYTAVRPLSDEEEEESTQDFQDVPSETIEAGNARSDLESNADSDSENSETDNDMILHDNDSSEDLPLPPAPRPAHRVLPPPDIRYSYGGGSGITPAAEMEQHVVLWRSKLSLEGLTKSIETAMGESPPAIASAPSKSIDNESQGHRIHSPAIPEEPYIAQPTDVEGEMSSSQELSPAPTDQPLPTVSTVSTVSTVPVPVERRRLRFRERLRAWAERLRVQGPGREPSSSRNPDNNGAHGSLPSPTTINYSRFPNPNHHNWNRINATTGNRQNVGSMDTTTVPIQRRSLRKKMLSTCSATVKRFWR
ncbi:hypothetical protein CcaverHIS002_0301440 [Cutaneotrichosporon cavernicola]|uniref:Uncharacterized protein n=1 Tax=Cutaneotrichosporon cavernicola TaxID=279322 RepID=A0AA48I936_9TREE|nr:uncharacterized protein CcaverHIS019_0301400 [Cutaneotrichosporon cavernicola]BEI82276.1 hypothetical protein CcaverHIS002_0301440 [Cutaneotrichosporon cavernicola]BEI90070.1 hypothetical protein CcaverHIS019_0301400 [Cutaneotrichosporon cavernicola]BEI97844.1 hypothetical protein CcaverHIS631_0301430 [Cutaneotrichosporon cavernicola]BEJ05621.1 hypothetical protein CcaverHIS641_0301430 [Cutaneotrichosporon cavernicola]